MDSTQKAQKLILSLYKILSNFIYKDNIALHLHNKGISYHNQNHILHIRYIDNNGHMDDKWQAEFSLKGSSIYIANINSISPIAALYGIVKNIIHKTETCILQNLTQHEFDDNISSLISLKGMIFNLIVILKELENME